MIRLIFFLFFSISLFASSLSLYDLGYLVSKSHHKSVIYSSNVDQKIKIIVAEQKIDYLPLFKEALNSNGYTLKVTKTYFYVSVPPKKEKDSGIFSSLNSFASSGSSDLKAPPPLVSSGSNSMTVTNNGLPIYSSPILGSKDSNSSYNRFSSNVPSSFKTLSLTYLNPADLNDTLRLSGFDYSISKSNKTIVFRVPDDQKKLFNNLETAIKSLDLPPRQVTLKITVFSSDNKKLRDLGFSPLLNLDFNGSYTSPNVLVGQLVGNFYTSLHLLDSKGATKITDTPVFLASDNETLDFKSVVNIAFLDDTTTVTSDTGTNQSTKYSYKPVGFKVMITPTIVNDTVYLDFFMSFEDVLSTGDRPTTSEKSIKNRFSLKKGELVLLAGISQNTKKDYDESIPYLSDLPYIGSIFKHEQKSNNDLFFNISVEVVND